MKTCPKVTIIMATYNREKYIIETLKSIQSQFFLDWECLIIDDGGFDNTIEIITPILEEDKRFQFFKRPEDYLKGLPGCRNYGLDLAKGDFIIFFDDDDIAHPQNLEICVMELSTREISFCRYIRAVFFEDFIYDFDLSKKYTSFCIDYTNIEKIVKNELLFNSCAVMWKKECFYDHRFVEHLMYAEEWELYSRIITNGFSGISINKILFYGRKHPESNTGEFFRNNPIRTASNAEAILLVLKNLHQKQLLTYPILRYFIQISLSYKRYNLKRRIVNELDLSTFEVFKLELLYSFLPMRLYFYGKWRKIIR